MFETHQFVKENESGLKNIWNEFKADLKKNPFDLPDLVERGAMKVVSDAVKFKSDKIESKIRLRQTTLKTTAEVEAELKRIEELKLHCQNSKKYSTNSLVELEHHQPFQKKDRRKLMIQ